MTDELYDDAVSLVRNAGQATTSLLQRGLRIGYARAVGLIDLMEAAGVVGPADGLKPREVRTEAEKLKDQGDLFA
jgi:S-DNA-T family DNA segregation ATPase FtsK/SpoIIIE